VAQAYVFGDEVPVVKVVAGLVASTELLSIAENMQRISGVAFSDVFKKLLPLRPNKDERGQ